MRISAVQEKRLFWRRTAVLRRWRRLCNWMARALEKLAEGG